MAVKLEKYLNDPRKAKKVHKRLGVGWFILAFPIMIFFNQSLPLLVFISVYAIVASHWAGWDAAGADLDIRDIKSTLAEIKKRV